MIHSSVGLLHTLAASMALLCGALIFFRAKGTPFHRICGYIYALSMLIVIVTSFCIYRLTGHLNILHFAAVLSAPPLVLGLVAVWGRRQNKEWLPRHYYWMGWSYIGLFAAFMAEGITRLIVPAASKVYGDKVIPLFWILVGVVSYFVVFIGMRLLQTKRAPLLTAYKTE
jgi:uncharacterized membrane protein